VRIPGTKVDMRIVPTGVASNGQMALPPNPGVAGWYRFGPDARAAHGSIVVAAHVDSIAYGLGPFVALRDLQRDAAIRLTDAQGRATVYRVDSVRHIRKAALTRQAIFDRDGRRRLTLITCGGSFDTRTRTYSDNIVVTARTAGG
jgi:hypothetical protein